MRAETVSSHDEIEAGRDRVSAVLAPLLGSGLARERANNIAQALVLGCDDPQEVAQEMLRHLDAVDVRKLAAAISQAWSGSSSGKAVLDAVVEACGTACGGPVTRPPSY